MEIKEIFDGAENGTLTYEQFQEAVKKAKANFTDLSEGKYVSKAKYEDDLNAKAEEIKTLNGTISTRDKDLKDLQTQLEQAGTDGEKLTELTNNLTALQGKYDTDTKAYKEQLQRQAYEFAVREFANTKEFTSKAAKKEFVNSMISEKLKMKDNSILGAEDFAKAYAEEDPDAFKIAKQEPAQEPTPQPKPQFVGHAPGNEGGGTKMSLSDMMAAKNENPNLAINF